MNSSHLFRPLALVALLGALLLPAGALTAVAATPPALAASPTTVAFDPVPGKPGTTTLSLTPGAAPVTLCVSDNGGPPTPVTTLTGPALATIPFPFIQAGVYTFTGAADAACKSPIAGLLVAVGRAGPTGLVGADDLALTPGGTQTIAPGQQFPLPGGKLCFMSGNGEPVAIDLLVGQDPNVYGVGAIDVTLKGILLGQNGCYPAAWIVNGYYQAYLMHKGTATKIVATGFCAGANTPNWPTGFNPPPPVQPEPPGAQPYHCAQVTYSKTVPGGGATPVQGGTATTLPSGGLNATPLPMGTVLTGAALTGADSHAIQICALIAVRGAMGGPYTFIGDTINAYNAAGAVNLTPFVLNYPSQSVVVLTTYDLTNAAAGSNGLLAPQQACGQSSVTVSNSQFNILSLTPPGNTATASVMDFSVFIIA